MYGTRQLTKDGIELTWAVNHLAPFLLSKLLLHRLKESAPARIITTTSQAHWSPGGQAASRTLFIHVILGCCCDR
jgi:NAD(P)-dependent dehydrogenase (short-subunit alcohol dehydrogenase family)